MRSLIIGPILPALLCLGLGAALYQQLARPADAGSMPLASLPGTERIAEGPETVPFDLPPVDSFREIASRPLFSPGRRPPTEFEDGPVAVETAPALPQELDVTVVGIVTGPRAVALLRRGGGADMIPLAKGQTLAGWTLTEIEPFRLVFRRGADEQEIELEFREE